MPLKRSALIFPININALVDLLKQLLKEFPATNYSIVNWQKKAIFLQLSGFLDEKNYG